MQASFYIIVHNGFSRNFSIRDSFFFFFLYIMQKQTIANSGVPV